MKPHLSCILLLLGCSDAGLKVYNNAPNVTFTSPTNGAEVASGRSLTLSAQVADRESPTEELSLFWTHDDGTTLAGDQTLSGEAVTFVTKGGFPEGEQGVVLTVTDPDAASGSATLTFTARPNASPTAIGERARRAGRGLRGAAAAGGGVGACHQRAGLSVSGGVD